MQLALRALTCPPVFLFSRSFAASPVPPSRQTSAGLEGNILLVEEYGALAAAIGSALKKFASRQSVHVAHSLGAAAELAEQHRPGLLLIDIDPPLDGTLAFLTRMKALLPDAKVLIIG